MKSPGIIYIWIYDKLKEKNRHLIVRTDILKQIISRALICNGGSGGSRKGIPKCYIYDIIKDMQEMGLIKRINHTKYEILKNNYKKQLKHSMW